MKKIILIGCSRKKILSGWANRGQITNPEEFHPLCQPQEVFDPKSGSCIPRTNVKGADPVGTLECPDGWVLDDALNMCVPASALDQASDESAAPFKATDKMERCIQNVKSRLRKNSKTFKDQSIKSAAIAICRSRLKQ